MSKIIAAINKWFLENTKISFTIKDGVRVVWVFVAAFFGLYYSFIQGLGPLKSFQEMKAAAAALFPAAIIAGVTALKNLVLKDGTTLKG